MVGINWCILYALYSLLQCVRVLAAQLTRVFNWSSNFPSANPSWILSFFSSLHNVAVNYITSCYCCISEHCLVRRVHHVQGLRPSSSKRFETHSRVETTAQFRAQWRQTKGTWIIIHDNEHVQSTTWSHAHALAAVV